MFSGQIQRIPVDDDPSPAGQLLRAVYHIPPIFKDSTPYSEFLLSVQYVVGRGRVSSWAGGGWHRGDTGSNSVSWASYYLAGFILQPKRLWQGRGILKTPTLNLERLEAEGPGAGAALAAPERGAQHPHN